MSEREPAHLRALRLINPKRTLRRRVLKTALLCAVVLLALYPNPVLLVRHVQRSLNMNGLIRPADPRVVELAEPFRQAAIDGRHSEVLAGVQAVVFKRLPYQYDWDNWGCANYFPTVEEAMTRGRSDCKGRAVVAASVLGCLGYSPRLVSDLSHVWVWTKEGETMGPVATKSGRRIVTADERGSRIDPRAVVSAGGFFSDMPLRVGFGVAIFPIERVVLVSSALWLVCLRLRPRWAWALLGAVLIGLALAAFRHWCANVSRGSAAGAWAAITFAVLGIALSRRRIQESPGLPGSAHAKPGK